MQFHGGSVSWGAVWGMGVCYGADGSVVALCRAVCGMGVCFSAICVIGVSCCAVCGVGVGYRAICNFLKSNSLTGNLRDEGNTQLNFRKFYLW